MANLNGKGERIHDAGHSAPSWQDYIDALKEEGRRYRPASLRAVLEKREQERGNAPVSSDGKTPNHDGAQHD